MKSLISILSYFIILFVIRKFRIGKIDHINQQTSCPNCRSSAKRISKNQIDKILIYITFNFIKIKRFECSSCYWEGIRR